MADFLQKKGVLGEGGTAEAVTDEGKVQCKKMSSHYALSLGWDDIFSY